MEHCPDHSGIEEKFTTILTEIRTLHDMQKVAVDATRNGFHQREKEHKSDIERLDKKIDEKVFERDGIIMSIRKQIASVENDVARMTKDIQKTIVRTLVWIIAVIGIPVMTWFVSQTVSLIMKGGAK